MSSIRKLTFGYRHAAVFAVTTLGAVGACSDDDTNPGNGAAGSAGSTANEGGSAGRGNAGNTGKAGGGAGNSAGSGNTGGKPVAGGGAGGDASSGEGGMPSTDMNGAGEAGEGGAPPVECGRAADTETRPKVRLVNARGPSFARFGAEPIGLRLRIDGAVVNLPVVPQQTEDSVSDYVAFDLPTNGHVSFGIQASGDGAQPKQDLEAVAVKAGDRFTVVALGSTLADSQALPESQNVVLKDDLRAVPCDKARFFFYKADDDLFVLDSIANAGAAESLFVAGSAQPIADGKPRVAAPANGADVPLTTSKLEVRLADPLLATPLGKYSFTLPQGSLAPGVAYYVLSLGTMGRNDGHSERLLLLPVADERAPVQVLHDPLVMFANVASLPAAKDLDIYADGERVAHHLLYLASEDAANSPSGGIPHAFLPPTGAALELKSAAGGAALLTRAATALEPGQLYFSIVSDAPQGSAVPLQQTFTKFEYQFPALPTGENAQTVVFVNGMPGSPALDFGSFVGNAPKGFSGVANNVAYGQASVTTGVQLPLELEAGLARLGVQQGANTATNLSIKSVFEPSAGIPTLYFAVGAWNTPGASLVALGLGAIGNGVPLFGLPLTAP